jgi:hypothetical protein
MATLIERATEVAQAQRARFVLASALPREASGREAMIGFEQQVARAVWRHGLDGGVCRLEGLYGSHAEESERHALLGPFVAAGIAATPAQIAAPLDALHWPLHVRDAVDGIVAMLHRGGPNCVRFAGAIPYRTRDLLATVEAVLGVPMTLETDFLDERRGTHPPQIGDARRLLRWRPRVGLFAGVEEQALAFQLRPGGSVQPGGCRAALQLWHCVHLPTSFLSTRPLCLSLQNALHSSVMHICSAMLP